MFSLGIALSSTAETHLLGRYTWIPLQISLPAAMRAQTKGEDLALMLLWVRWSSVVAKLYSQRHWNFCHASKLNARQKVYGLWLYCFAISINPTWSRSINIHFVRVYTTTTNPTAPTVRDIEGACCDVVECMKFSSDVGTDPTSLDISMPGNFTTLEH